MRLPDGPRFRRVTGMTAPTPRVVAPVRWISIARYLPTRMDQRRDTNDRHGGSSPWPIFVAVGLAISEVGIVLPAYTMAVGGLLLLVGSVAGILTEAGYVQTPWPLLSGLALVLVAAGTGLYVLTGAPLSPDAAVLSQGGSVAVRGLAVVLAGVLSLLGAVTGSLVTDGPSTLGR